MTTLRKKILYSKIENTLTQNNFVLFFQFNNIKFKQWILLKNQIKNLETTTMVVTKNKITYETLNKHMLISHLNKNKEKSSPGLENKHVSRNENIPFNLKSKKKQLGFLCQGPTLLIAFKSPEECKIIYEIVNRFTYNLPYTKQQLESKKSFPNLVEFKASCLENRKFPSIFTKNNLVSQSQKHNLFNLNNEKFSFFFIGGVVQGKLLNHLDLEKLSNLNNSVYIHLIQLLYNPIMGFSLLKTVTEIKLLKCFENNFISLLNIHKNNLKKS